MLRPVALVSLGIGLVSCSTTRSRVDSPLTAKSVDLSRYTGRWYEIARLPMRFQKANEAAIVECGTNAVRFTLADGLPGAVLRCHRDPRTGSRTSAQASSAAQ